MEQIVAGEAGVRGRRHGRWHGAAVEDGGLYAIGDTSPGGGMAFYDKGKYSDGWRYMECAPASTETWAKWGVSDKPFNNRTIDTDLADEPEVGGTAAGIGTGAANTKAIAALLSAQGLQDRAAQICDALSYGGKDDWFLPSKDELSEMKPGGQRFRGLS